MTYSLPLTERLRKSEYNRARYWSDAEFRLKQINRYRARKGLPAAESLDDTTSSRHGRKRDARGRFV